VAVPQVKSKKKHRLQPLLFPLAEMNFSPLRLSATVTNFIPQIPKFKREERSTCHKALIRK